MPAPLTVRNAQITTAAVEVKTLTITGKQVTLAVFRQLREVPLIADDGTLNGVPWGTVNYHPDKCSGAREHLHVVWQDGDQLRRSAVLTEPKFPSDELYDQNPAFWPDEGNQLYAACVHHWLVTGEVAYWKGGLFELFSGNLKSNGGCRITEPYSQRRYVEDRDEITFVSEPTGVRVGIEIPQEARDAALAEINVREVRNKALDREEEQEHYESAWCDCASCKQCKLTSTEAERKERLGALADAYVTAPLADLWAAYCDAVSTEGARRKQYRAAETERRQRHRDVRKALADLPQLFIAV